MDTCTQGHACSHTHEIKCAILDLALWTYGAVCIVLLVWVAMQCKTIIQKKKTMFRRMTSLSLKWAASTNTTTRRNKVYIRLHWHKQTVWIHTHLRSYGRNMWLLENNKMKHQVIICSPNPLLCFFQLKKNPPPPQFPPDKTCVLSTESL